MLFNVNTAKKNVPQLFKDLEKNVHENIPESKCLGCPINGGREAGIVTAECCRKASPSMYYVEFLYVYSHIQQNWKKDDIKELAYKAFEAILDTSPEKPCILLDQETNKCRVYKSRWTNCRTYGMVPGSEWVERAKFWVTEKLRDKVTKVVKATKKVKTTVLTGAGLPMYVDQEVDRHIPDPEKLEAYVEELFADGFDPDKINARLEKDYGITKLVYSQCKNIEVKGMHFGMSEVYENLAKLESRLMGYDITTDPDNATYLAFHLYLLAFLLGEEKVQQLVIIRNTWNDEQKKKFLADISKGLDNLVDTKLILLG